MPTAVRTCSFFRAVTFLTDVNPAFQSSSGTRSPACHGICPGPAAVPLTLLSLFLIILKKLNKPYFLLNGILNNRRGLFI